MPHARTIAQSLFCLPKDSPIPVLQAAAPPLKCTLATPAFGDSVVRWQNPLCSKIRICTLYLWKTRVTPELVMGKNKIIYSHDPRSKVGPQDIYLRIKRLSIGIYTISPICFWNHENQSKNHRYLEKSEILSKFVQSDKFLSSDRTRKTNPTRRNLWSFTHDLHWGKFWKDSRHGSIKAIWVPESRADSIRSGTDPQRLQPVWNKAKSLGASIISEQTTLLPYPLALGGKLFRRAFIYAYQA